MEPTTPFGAAFFADPFPTFAHLREHLPFEKVNLFGEEAWLATRFDDVVAVLSDRRFVLRGNRQLEGQPPGLSGPLGMYPHLMNTDGLDHRRLRGLVSRGFTPTFVEGLRPQVRQMALDLIDVIEASGEREFDLIEAFAFPLPINVISGMLGLPAEDHAKLRAWSDAIFSDIGNPDADIGAEMEAFTDYLHQLFEQKRQQPGEDLVSALVRAEEAGDTLSEEELVAMVVLLIFAGHETTVNLLGNGMLALFTHPAELAKLRAQPDLMASAVEELLRLQGPVTVPAPRVAVEDVALGDRVVRAGEKVFVALASANYDETHFTNAAELDVARTLNRHLAFGRGVHMCLGAPLARLEGQEGIAALLERFPNLGLNADPGALTWRANPALRGLQALPLRY